MFEDVSFDWVASLDANHGPVSTYIESLQMHRRDISHWFPRFDDFASNLSSFVTSWLEAETHGKCCLFATFYDSNGYVEAQHLLADLPSDVYLIVVASKYEPLDLPRVHVIGAPADDVKAFNAKVGGHLSRFIRLQPAGSVFNPTLPSFDFEFEQYLSMSEWVPSVGGRKNVHIVDGDVLFDFLSLLRPDATSLLVVGQSAVGRSDSRPLPIYQRWTWAEEFEGGAFIVLNDPMLYSSDELGAGWWFGTEGRDILSEMATVIKRAAAAIGLGPEKIFFYGGSAGGFSSLQMASCLPGSSAIADIPQLDMRKYHDRAAANAAASVAFGVEDISSVPDWLSHRVSVVDRFLHEGNVPNFLLLQNLEDSSHLISQFYDFLGDLIRLQGRGGLPKAAFEVSAYSALSLVRGGHFPLDRRDTMENIHDYVRRRALLAADPRV